MIWMNRASRIHLVYFRMSIVKLINFFLNRSLFTFCQKFGVVTGDVRCRILCRKTCTQILKKRPKCMYKQANFVRMCGFLPSDIPKQWLTKGEYDSELNKEINYLKRWGSSCSMVQTKAESNKRIQCIEINIEKHVLLSAYLPTKMKNDRYDEYSECIDQTKDLYSSLL